MNLIKSIFNIFKPSKKNEPSPMTIQKRDKKPVKKAKTIIVKKQTKGTPANSPKKDSKRVAMKPGLRISKGGNLYTETRKDRSDKDPKLKK